MPAQADLAVQGEQLANELFAAQAGPYREAEFGRDVKSTRYEGISGTGWTYVDLWGKLGGSATYLRVLMAQMGNQVLPVFGLTTSIDCMGAGPWRDNDVWALLFHSLKLPGYAEDSPQLAQQIIGTWTGVGVGVANSRTFAPNGRFGSLGMSQTYRSSSTPGMVLQITESWPGDGPYEIHGDRLHTQNAKASEVERDVTRFFSIVRRPNVSRPGQFDYILRMVCRSDNGRIAGNSPSGNYVFALTKEQ
jgi:hypothetical protein